MKKTHQTLKYKRRRQGKTDYKARLRLLLSEKHRLVIRKSLKNMIAQLIDYSKKGDKIIASASSRNLEKYGWKSNKGNIPAAYLTGLLIGKKAAKANIKEAIVDLGLSYGIKGSREYALIKGAQDAGLVINCPAETAPDEKRLNGSHIAEYAALLKKENVESYNRIFSDYLKNKVNPEELTKIFEQVKNKIMAE